MQKLSKKKKKILLAVIRTIIAYSISKSFYLKNGCLMGYLFWLILFFLLNKSFQILIDTVIHNNNIYAVVYRLSIRIIDETINVIHLIIFLFFFPFHWEKNFFFFFKRKCLTFKTRIKLNWIKSYILHLIQWIKYANKTVTKMIIYSL